MPIFSLPGKYGIGTLGRAAYDFVDFLVEAGQRYWQILPVGPTGYGDSPYQSFSSFAGNPYFIDLEFLIEAGDIAREDVEKICWGEREDRIDYGRIYEGRSHILEKVFRNAGNKYREEVQDFCAQNAFWLEDYALYMALKKHFGMRAFIDWEDKKARLREREAIEAYKQLLEEDIRYYTFIQFLFYRQWKRLKAYANAKGIQIIGDIPIYVSLDSSDCWANAGLFVLDEENIPTFIAGVPPDYFSEDGQLWGNPLYRWEEMKKDNYAWWKQRIKGAGQLYDLIRIDHFRAFESFFKVKYGEKTARNGEWIKGPGMDFIAEMKNSFPEIGFIAEDLGMLTDEVRSLLKDSGFPGMKVLSFAFTPDAINAYLPHTYQENCVCYAGTHDNDTLCSWVKKVDKRELDFAVKYGGLHEKEGYHRGIIRLGLASPANLFVAQLQDYMGLGEEARINTPGTAEGNWVWRLQKLPDKSLAEEMAYACFMYSR